MKKKIILIFSMLSLLVCIFAVSVSASEITFVCQDEYETSDLIGENFNLSHSLEYEGLPCVLNYINCSSIYGFEPNSFKTFVDFHLNKNGDSTYQEWYEFCSNKVDEQTNDGVLMSWYYEEDSLNESFFNKLYNYKPITVENLTTEYNKGKTDGVTEYKESEEYTTILETKFNEGVNSQAGIINDLNTNLNNKTTELEAVKAENTSLLMNVNSLENQVDGLVDNRIALNAEITSLKNQMQLKINKAYAEGLQDSDGNGNRMNGFITTMISILTLLEVLALVYYIVSKVKKKRSQK